MQAGPDDRFTLLIGPFVAMLNVDRTEPLECIICFSSQTTRTREQSERCFCTHRRRIKEALRLTAELPQFIFRALRHNLQADVVHQVDNEAHDFAVFAICAQFGSDPNS